MCSGTTAGPRTSREWKRSSRGMHPPDRRRAPKSCPESIRLLELVGADIDRAVARPVFALARMHVLARGREIYTAGGPPGGACVDCPPRRDQVIVETGPVRQFQHRR